MDNSGNPFLPDIGTVGKVIHEAPNIKSLQVVLNDQHRMQSFRFEPGQVAQLSIFGVGEATFVINSPPTRMEYLQFSIMRAGEVTERLHQLKEADPVGVRGPLGNWFPYEEMKGKDIYFIGGGIGMAPLRTLLLFMLDNREDYGNITLLYGARSPQDLCYKEELKDWEGRDDMELILTVDREFPDWDRRVGLVPNVLKELAPSPEGKVAVTCGPPIMIRFTLQALDGLGFKDDQVITTLERRMKCGIGLCGRCNIGTKYVCTDGPVFSLAQLKELPPEL
ncbi:MAG: FAD/NAD(P)-binding protein [Deltaproteobacteria bacterium]|nr:MAG: FAD/NAD(P)-binding protein [Deltaproteobacteria bacterium]